MACFLLGKTGSRFHGNLKIYVELLDQILVDIYQCWIKKNTWLIFRYFRESLFCIVRKILRVPFLKKNLAISIWDYFEGRTSRTGRKKQKNAILSWLSVKREGCYLDQLENVALLASTAFCHVNICEHGQKCNNVLYI